MVYVISRNSLSPVDQNIGRQRVKHSKSSTQIQTNRSKKQNPTAGTTTKCNTFRSTCVFLVPDLKFL